MSTPYTNLLHETYRRAICGLPTGTCGKVSAGEPGETKVELGEKVYRILAEKYG